MNRVKGILAASVLACVFLAVETTSASVISTTLIFTNSGPVSLVNTNAVSVPAGLVAWWPGNGNGTDVVGGNNAILPDAGVTFSNAEVGQGFVFDGSTNSVMVPDAANLNFPAGQDFSIEAWILPQHAPANSPADEMIIAYKRYAANAYQYIGYAFYLANNGQLFFLMGDEPLSIGGLIVNAGPDLRDGQFHHVAVTIQRNSTTGGHLYVDGTNVLTFDPTTESGSLANTEPLLIGSQSTPGYTTPFKGIIDELSIYRRALSADDIAAIYNAGSAGKIAPTNSLPPAGLVGWWKGDGNGVDSVSGNNGTLVNCGYTSGVVGQAFSFDPNNFQWGTYTGVQVADRPEYALTNALTIEGWVRPRGDGYQIFFRGDHRPGLDPYYLSMQANNTLRFGITDADGNGAYVDATVNYFSWTHVAALLDGDAGTLSIYTNGVLAAQTSTSIRPFGALLPDQSPGIGIGNVNDGGNNFPFIGDIDEISLYNRALSAGEILAIYNAGSAGKSGGSSFPPVITVQPVSQTVGAGDSATFCVTASGAAPLAYQWKLNGTAIAGATSASLTLTNLHVLQSGNYSVTITNAAGTVTSSDAVLTVTARDILVYDYSGNEKVTTFGEELSYNYTGRMFFVPSGTNGVFVGWATVNGRKQYRVSPFSDYLWITIPGNANHVYTVLGRAGDGWDENGQPHLWSYLHRGLNTQLVIGTKKKFSFPMSFDCNETHVYPNPGNGNMILREATSTYLFATPDTQSANNSGKTLADLVNSLTKSLAKQGYRK